MADPDERVGGQGVAQLREAGITVDLGLLESAARRLNEAYIKHRSTGLPFVTLKLAQSLDGRIATPSGDSRWITSPESRTRAHALRADADAVLVGINTVVVDDPQLSVRHVEGPDPVKIVLDSGLRISASARIFEGTPLIVAASDGVPEPRRAEIESAGGRVWTFPPCEGRPRLEDVLARVAQEDLIHLLIEGGGTVAASALREGLVDRLAVFIAPKVLGDGIPSVADLGIAQVAQAVGLDDVDVERIGGDLFYTARVRTPVSSTTTKA
jgi:diaminohydroxyphosphoribosylaminopyrimidine deaminase/5-amino-6-(5-phosphoribosylamino)uracil reductase